jgi:ATP-dependent DNA helicase DinG
MVICPGPAFAFLELYGKIVFINMMVRASGSRRTHNMPGIDDIFGEKGLLSHHIARYENRPVQVEMARAIEKIIEDERQLIVEAGTGVGKSLAYLVPFIFWAHRDSMKVLVSTYTKALQLQLMEKDLPFLQAMLGIPFRFALCMGGQNYLCLRRFNQVNSNGLFESLDEAREMKRIVEWRENSVSGLKSELSFEPLPSLWSRISRESDLCAGWKCPLNSHCYYQEARARQKESHILVANHHLFFANLASGERVLPPYNAVVFDEAHNIEEVAAHYLGIEVSTTRLKHLLDSLYNPRTGRGLLARAATDDAMMLEAGKKAVQDMRTCADIFFDEVVNKFRSMKPPYRLREGQWIFNSLKEPLERLAAPLKRLGGSVAGDDEQIELGAYLGRIEVISKEVAILIEHSEPEYVYWAELQRRGTGYRTVLHGAPINVASLLEERVFNETAPLVLTSATLSTAGSFDYLKGRLGISSPEELLLDSPFNYRENTLLYLSSDLPDPGREAEDFERMVIMRVKELLDITGGRTFVLFTSLRLLDRAYEFLCREARDVTLLRQGDMPHHRMIENFKEDERAVLLGTNTFWQGVDIPGRALEAVIITKLPFAVPDDPLTEARIEFMESQHLEPFTSYQLPQAIIWLKQGFGRLIRSHDDRGMVAILDPRVVKRSYGRKFISSLPACSRTGALSDVASFFLALRGEAHHTVAPLSKER